jgi:hypothetical protein
MTTDAPPRRRAHTVEVPAHQLRLRRRVVTRALAAGDPVDRDALAALMGAHHDDPDGGPAPACPPWTVASLTELLWVGVVDWCDRHGATVPDPHRVRTTLLTLLDQLADIGALPPGSDPVRALRRVVADTGGSARRRGHPAGGRRTTPGRRPAVTPPVS